MAPLIGLNSCIQYKYPVNISEFRVEKFSMRRYYVRSEGRGYVHLDGDNNGKKEKKSLRILIAGGGIAGLVLALAAKNRGFEVKVFEKDLSAVRGEGRHRGPIQLLSNALAVLEAIDENVAKQIMEAGCVTGNRINGIADGLSGEWFAKFDLLTPAIRRGLPLTLVISRMSLQDILVNAVGPEILSNKSKVVDFMEESNKVTITLADGCQYDGEVLIGADGIWSEVRSKLFGRQEAKYSNYTCYSGLTNFVPPYISTVGYRVFLGRDQYFVASDIGNGKMQWYAFNREPPMNNIISAGGKKTRLLNLFRGWCDEVITLIMETPDHMISQRDIYDRDMIYSWGTGRVTLVGDAAHPMQPNLGQGGCMAIEDCYQLILELDKIANSRSSILPSDQIVSALRRYEKKRLFRVSTIHTASRMASQVLAVYEPYIEFGFVPLPGLSTLRIIHPGIRVARMLFPIFMQQFMTWMISGHGLTI